MIVSGILETREAAGMFTAAVPDTELTICRLRATPETLRERVFQRSRGGGPQIPGDQELNGASQDQLLEIVKEGIEAAELMEQNDIGNLRIDTDGLSIQEIARHILSKAEGWPALLHAQSAESVR
jgi:hypothetical protein